MTERYAIEHTHDALESLVLHDRASRSSVTLAPSRGGMVTRYVVGDQPVLFLDESTLRDPKKNVRGGIPVLFPIAGKLHGNTLRDGARSYEMKQHGFARDLPWTVASESTSDGDGAVVTLSLRANRTTLEGYPHGFELQYAYALRDGVLTLTQTTRNESAGPMRVQSGLHPYFFVPDATKRDAWVEIDATHGTDNRTGQPVTVNGPIDLTATEVDLHLMDQKARTVRLKRPGLPTVKVSFGDDQRVLVIWTLAGRDFVCVEPWADRANALNEGGGIEIPAGGEHRTVLRIECETP